MKKLYKIILHLSSILITQPKNLFFPILMDEMLKKICLFGGILKVNTSITLPWAEIIYFPGCCIFLFEFQLLYSAGPSAIALR